MSGQVIDVQKGFVEPLAEKIKTLGSFLELGDLESISKDGHAKLVKYNPDEILIKEGEYDNWVYWLISGHVAVVKNGIEVKQFRRFGDMFGEMGIIEGEMRSASIIAREETLCLTVDASIIDHLPPEKKALCWGNFLKHVAHEGITRLTETTDEFVKTKEEMEITKQKLAEAEKKLYHMEEDLKRAQEKIHKLGKLVSDQKSSE